MTGGRFGTVPKAPSDLEMARAEFCARSRRVILSDELVAARFGDQDARGCCISLQLLP
jgi:hypothetical protein